MKLSKSLLSAIVVGIAVQTAASCHKTNLTPEQKATEAQKTLPKTGRPSEPQSNPNIYPCPACGMG